MKVIFYGTRGSIPVAEKDFLLFGGNTACIFIRFDNGRVAILDAGTGIRKLGEDFVHGSIEQYDNIYVLLSHTHWASTLDSQSGKATVFFAGYCKNEPVIIGPYTRTISAQNFARCTKDNIDTELLGEGAVIKQVPKFKNNGREIMAEILIEK